MTYKAAWSASSELKFLHLEVDTKRFCSLVVRVPGYRSRGPSSIPGATVFSEK
jgi:hypothetical protein